MIRLRQNGGVSDRGQLIRELRGSGISDGTVLTAMATVPRDEFVPPEYRGAAWEDHPLPIGSGQTISQPYIVAYMTEMLRLRPGDRVLDVGTGCGYQAAVLHACGARVWSIEVRPELAERARATLERLGFSDITVVCGDGAQGLPDVAPFDGIVVAAATGTVPQALLDQLRPPESDRPGGRLILPLSDNGRGAWHDRLRVEEESRGWPGEQRLVLFERTGDGVRRTDLVGVRFVPLISPPGHR